MRWNNLALVLAGTTVLCWALLTAGAGGEPQLAVYTAQSSYSLPVLDRGGQSYVSVAELLSPLGAPPPRAKGKEWRVVLNKAEVRLTEGKEKATVRGSQFDLGGAILVEDNRVLAPLAAAMPLLSRLLNTSVDFHQPSRRVFVGNAFTRFTAAFKDGESPTLVLNFSQPVHPDGNHEEDRNGLSFTHTNRTTLLFKKDPLVSDVNKQQFGDGAIQSLSYTEENGAAALTVTGSVALQIVRSDDGKTITLQPAAPVATATPEPAASAPSAETQRRAPEFFVMIDPSHGGLDKGATFGSRLLEKDITLKLARELRKELEDRGIPARMLRDSDIDMTQERRAEITNEQRAGIYLALHAGRPGRGVRVYASLLANPQGAAGGRFLPWESAQAPALDRSKTVAQAISAELRKRGMSVATLGIPLRPLNNIVSPAIAVELAPEGDDLQSLESPKRNASVASAIAAAIVQVRGQMGGRP